MGEDMRTMLAVCKEKDDLISRLDIQNRTLRKRIEILGGDI